MNCGGGGGEDHLEHPEGQDPGVPVGGEVAEEEAGGAEPARLADPEHQAEADGPVEYGTHGKIHEVFHNDIDGVFGARKAGLDHGKAGLHKEHQCRGD